MEWKQWDTAVVFCFFLAAITTCNYLSMLSRFFSFVISFRHLLAQQLLWWIFQVQFCFLGYNKRNYYLVMRPLAKELIARFQSLGLQAVWMSLWKIRFRCIHKTNRFIWSLFSRNQFTSDEMRVNLRWFLSFFFISILSGMNESKHTTLFRVNVCVSFFGQNHRIRYI